MFIKIFCICANFATILSRLTFVLQSVPRAPARSTNALPARGLWRFVRNKRRQRRKRMGSWGERESFGIVRTLRCAATGRRSRWLSVGLAAPSAGVWCLHLSPVAESQTFRYSRILCWRKRRSAPSPKCSSARFRVSVSCWIRSQVFSLVLKSFLVIYASGLFSKALPDNFLLFCLLRNFLKRLN